MKLQWFEEKVPENIKISQVYGVVFNKNGETLLKYGDKKGRDCYYLAGGTPEKCGKDMVAMIDQIGERKPDPDCGKTYGRVLAKPERAIELLSWGEIGARIVRKAAEVAAEKFGLDFSNADDIIISV